MKKILLSIFILIIVRNSSKSENNYVLPGPPAAYNFMKGLKRDLSPWVAPPGGWGHITRYVYTGDPESGIGWDKSQPGKMDQTIHPEFTFISSKKKIIVIQKN
jgi:hypothetical protein